MKNTIQVPAILLTISTSVYFTVIYDGSLRMVEFIFVVGIGVLVGVLLTQFFYNLKKPGSQGSLK